MRWPCPVWGEDAAVCPVRDEPRVSRLGGIGARFIYFSWTCSPAPSSRQRTLEALVKKALERVVESLWPLEVGELSRLGDFDERRLRSDGCHRSSFLGWCEDVLGAHHHQHRAAESGKDVPTVRPERHPPQRGCRAGRRIGAHDGGDASQDILRSEE